ncbi:MAG: FCD domain-containing protein [Pseudomonadota bacterium]
MTDKDAFLAPWEEEGASHPFVKAEVKVMAKELFLRLRIGAYPYGTRIPAERALAEELGTSRATLRQVLAFLEGFDMLAKRIGSGTFVTYRGAVTPADPEAPAQENEPPLADVVSPFEINITRAIFEPEIARLAAIYMSYRDQTALGAVLQQVDEITTEAGRFADLERDFFMTLCEGTHNALLIAMYRIMHDIRRQPQWSLNKTRSLTPARIKEAKQGLRSIYVALERRNIESAVECMRLYISNMQEELIYTSS